MASEIHKVLRYRPEIDGLRAVAVLLVIFYHANVGLSFSGYLGVDIFFVISGYLIGAIYLQETITGKFSTKAFIGRRLRRVLPALFLVCLLSLIPAWYLLPPKDFQSLSQSIVSNVFAVSNNYFNSKVGYFDRAAEMKPLLHTWSLGVEIQFYLLVALIGWVRLKYRIMPGIWLLCICAVLSFSLYVYLFIYYRSASFFLTPARLWEFMAGMYVAYSLSKKPTVTVNKNNVYTMIGLVLLVVSVAANGISYVNQVVVTAGTVVATALLIRFITPDSYVVRLLNLKILVGIGAISYSLYLFHNPILSFARFAGIEQSISHFAVALVCMFVLSYFSWKYIENPFRNRKLVTTNIFVGYLIFLTFIFGYVLYWANKTEGVMYGRLSEKQEKVMNTATTDNKKRRLCQAHDKNEIPPSDACVVGKGKLGWAIVGDSHTGSIATVFGELIHEKTGRATKWLGRGGCHPDYLLRPKSACGLWLKSVVNYLIETPDIETIVIIYMLNTYLYDNNSGHNLDSASMHEKTYRDKVWESYQAVIDILSNAGKEVVVISTVPKPLGHVPDLIYREIENKSDLYGVTRKDWDKRNAYAVKKFSGLAGRVKVFYPETALCDDKMCYAVRDNVSYYYDHNHLSTSGARLLAEKFAEFYWH